MTEPLDGAETVSPACSAAGGETVSPPPTIAEQLGGPDGPSPSDSRWRKLADLSAGNDRAAGRLAQIGARLDQGQLLDQRIQLLTVFLLGPDRALDFELAFEEGRAAALAQAEQAVRLAQLRGGR